MIVPMDVTVTDDMGLMCVFFILQMIWEIAFLGYVPLLTYHLMSSAGAIIQRFLRSFYAQKLIHKNAYIQKMFDTKQFLHTDAFAHRRS